MIALCFSRVGFFGPSLTNNSPLCRMESRRILKTLTNYWYLYCILILNKWKMPWKSVSLSSTEWNGELCDVHTMQTHRETPYSHIRFRCKPAHLKYSFLNVCTWSAAKQHHAVRQKQVHVDWTAFILSVGCCRCSKAHTKNKGETHTNCLLSRNRVSMDFLNVSNGIAFNRAIWVEGAKS